MLHYFKTNVPDDSEIRQTLRDREMRIEKLINRIRIIFMLVICLFDVSTFLFLGKAGELSVTYVSTYLGPIAGYIIIQFILSRNKYLPWIKYYTLAADYTGTTLFTLFYLNSPEFQAPITTKEMLICISFILLFFNTLSLYRGFKQVVIFSSVICIASNIFIFAYAGAFFLMGVYTTILMICFSLFFIWAGDKIIHSVISNLQISRAMEEIKEANAEITQQNEEISTQRDEIESKSKLLEQKNHETRQSIEYSLRIQKALIPDAELIKKIIPESFIIYKPKDIVSGDFYWFKVIDGSVVIAAADCTGHGVPGAFMSLIGAEKLEDAISQNTSPGQILSVLNNNIKNALHQDGSDEATRDGMDIAIYLVSPDRSKITYAGANRPLWILRSNEIIEIKATKCAIGGTTPFNQKFEESTLTIEKNDIIYTFSDGFADQFGGTAGKKMMTKKLKEELISISKLSMQEQKIELEKFFNEWKGSNEQVDDVLLIGTKL